MGADFTVIDENGNALSIQTCNEGVEVLVDVAPFGSTEITFVPGQEILAYDKSLFVLDEHVLETPFYVISWNDNGQLTRIYDKDADREVLHEGQEGNVLEIYEDKSVDYDAWDIDIYYTEKVTKVNVTEPPTLIESGPLKAVVRFCYRYNQSSRGQSRASIHDRVAAAVEGRRHAGCLFGYRYAGRVWTCIY